jgi:hypothetical protein
VRLALLKRIRPRMDTVKSVEQIVNTLEAFGVAAA